MSRFSARAGQAKRHAPFWRAPERGVGIDPILRKCQLLRLGVSGDGDWHDQFRIGASRGAAGPLIFRPNVPNESLSSELRTFIGEYVHSVEQLEILCLFSEGGPKARTLSEVFRVIQSSEQSVARCLDAFCRNQLLVSRNSGSYEFAPGKTGQGEMVAALTKAYRERRVAVIEAIYQRPGDTIQDFADAFKLRKDK